MWYPANHAVCWGAVWSQEIVGYSVSHTKRRTINPLTSDLQNTSSQFFGSLSDFAVSNGDRKLEQKPDEFWPQSCESASFTQISSQLQKNLLVSGFSSRDNFCQEYQPHSRLFVDAKGTCSGFSGKCLRVPPTILRQREEAHFMKCRPEENRGPGNIDRWAYWMQRYEPSHPILFRGRRINALGKKWNS